MSAIVVGCGRSGTNVALEMLSGSPDLKASEAVEEKNFFKEHKVYPISHLTKCDTCYITDHGFDVIMGLNPDLKVVWTIRNPRDILMSKIRRGAPSSQGGDSPGLSSDGTVQGAIQDMNTMTNMFRRFCLNWKDRIHVIRMEDMISLPRATAFAMSRKLGISFDEGMVDFPSRMRNSYKKKRYGNKIDKSQVNMWLNWRTMYDRWFPDNGYDMNKEFDKIKSLVTYWGYNG